MSVRKATSKGSARPYKQWLIQAEELRGQAGVIAFDRAKLLTQAYEDQEFLAECRVTKRAAEEVLDEYVDDLCLTFLELRQLYQHFPKRRSWEQGKLASMYRQAVEAADAEVQRSKQQTGADRYDPSPPSRRTVKLADHEALEEQLRDVKSRRLVLEEEVAQLRNRVQQLEAENRRLRRMLGSRKATAAA